MILTLLSITVYYFHSTDKNNKSKGIKEKLPLPVKEEEKVFSLSFVATGDALIHGAVYSTAHKNGIYDFKPMLALVKPIIEPYDLAFYNQETIFAGKEIGYSHYPRFNTPSEFGDATIDAGFNIVALSNNHSYDKGENGVLNAIGYWKSQSVMYNGINDSFQMQDNIQVMTKNNISYALVSYTTVNNGLNTPTGKEYLVNYYSDERAKRDIEYLKEKQVDVIIISMHWGNEYTHVPIENQKRIANYLSELGVNIIVGHHPHVLQPIEKINNTIVMYSLGNFISAQIEMERLTGALVSLNITKTINKNGTTISLSTPNVEVIYTDVNNRYLLVPFSKMENITALKENAYNDAVRIITSLDNTISVAPIKQN
jgi:poly-gamma-glutamate synthesis protein (capsule biosynthesis protein)